MAQRGRPCLDRPGERRFDGDRAQTGPVEVTGKVGQGAVLAGQDITEITAQGLQMFALCGKKESNAESPRKREMREEIYNKRFESEGKKFLDEIRKQAMIEYLK